MASYSRIKFGMSYSEVAQILGSPGTEDVRTTTPGVNIVIASYVWKNADGSNVVCHFQNDELKIMAQAGLR